MTYQTRGPSWTFAMEQVSSRQPVGSRRLKRVLWLFAGANFIAALALKLAHEEIPSKALWASIPWWIPALAFGITISVPTIQPLLIEIGEKRLRQRLQLADDVRQFLAAGLVKIVEDTTVDWKSIGVHAFLVKGRWSRWQTQERVAKVKLSTIVPSGVTWKREKGVIGRCWQTRRPVTVDLRAHFAPYLGYARDQWDALASEVRFGLSHEEFVRTRDHYGVVSAVPILDRKDRYVGCVSLDAPNDCPKDLSFRVIEEDLRGVAVLLERFLGKTDS